MKERRESILAAMRQRTKQVSARLVKAAEKDKPVEPEPVRRVIMSLGGSHVSFGRFHRSH